MIISRTPIKEVSNVLNFYLEDKFNSRNDDGYKEMFFLVLNLKNFVPFFFSKKKLYNLLTKNSINNEIKKTFKLFVECIYNKNKYDRITSVFDVYLGYSFKTLDDLIKELKLKW